MKITTVIISIFLVQITLAQTCVILDKNTEMPIANVKITDEKGHTVMSNQQGEAILDDFENMQVLTMTHMSYVEFELMKRPSLPHGAKIYLQFKTELLGEVFLSASKTEEKITRIAEQIATISNSEIERISPQTSADMLANIPGVRVQKTQFGGGSPVLRGMESNRVLLVVDGIRMNNAIYRKGHLQNSITVSPIGLDRTEVVFGPSSVVYGSDALGGAIHYYTRIPRTSDQSNINVDFLSRVSSVNQEITVQGGVELQMKNLATYTSISHSNFGDLVMGKNRNHGFTDWGKQFEYSNNSEFYYNDNPISNDNPNQQRRVGYEQLDLLQKAFIPLNTQTELHFNVQFSNSTNINRFDKLTEYSGDDLKFAEWHYGPQQRFLAASQLKMKNHKKWMEGGTITLAYQNIKESRINRKFNSLDRATNKEKLNIVSINGDFTANPTQSNDRNFGYGFEMSYNDVNSTSVGETLEVEGHKVIGVSDYFNTPTRYPDGGSSYLSSAVYLQYRQDINAYSTLNTGLRLTNTMLKALWLENDWIELPQNDIKLKNTALTATIGYAYKPTDDWQINGVLSSGLDRKSVV